MAFLQTVTLFGTFLLLLVLPLVCSTALADSVVAPKFAIFLVGAGLITAAFSVGAASKYWIPWKRSRLTKVAVAFYVWSLFASICNGLHPHAVPGSLTALFLAAIALAWSSSRSLTFPTTEDSDDTNNAPDATGSTATAPDTTADTNNAPDATGSTTTAPATTDDSNQTPAPNVATITTLIGWLTFSGLLVGLYSWLQRLTPLKLSIFGIPLADPVLWSHPHLSQERTIATFGNPDYLAAWLVVLIPLSLYWILTREKRLLRGFGLGFWFLVVLTTILTQTRAAWVALAASSLLWFSLSLRSRTFNRRQLVTTAAILAVLVVSSFSAIALQQNAAGTEFSLSKRLASFTDFRDLSLRTRLYFWHSALRTAARHPFIGVGSAGQPIAALQDRDLEPLELRELCKEPESVHNQYLQTLAESGLPGFLLLLASIYLFARILCKRRDLLSISLLSAGAAHWTVQLFISSTLTTEVIWVFLLSAAALLEETTSPADVSSNMPPRPMPWLAAIAGILLFLATLTTATLIVASQRLIWCGDDNRLMAQQMLASQKFDRQDILTMYKLALDDYTAASTIAPAWSISPAYTLMGHNCEEVYSDVSQSSDFIMWEKAREHYQMAMALDPYHANVWIDLARILAKNPAARKKSVEHVDQALAIDPRNPTYLVLKAQVLSDLQRNKEAQQVLNTANAIAADMPNILLTQAAVAYRLHDNSTGDAILERLTKLHPEYALTAANLRRQRPR